MHAKRIEAYVETMVSLGQDLFDSFQPGEIRDIHADMTQVTLSIIARTIFGMDADPSPRLMELSHIGQTITLEESTMPLPEWLSGSRNRRADEVNEGLDALVNTIMTERRNIGHEGRTDLLSLLMQSTDESGQPVPDEFVRNNILTLYFAGHETTANTLTWALTYLNQNPAAAEKLRAEVDSVLGDRLPTLEDLPNLRYAEMVFKETMRIEPTVATLVRFVADDVPLGSYQLKGGSTLFTPIYVVHHDPRWWDAPHEFRPERFSAENEPNIPKFAYFPFGGGPRICIGNHFAMMEGQILLAMLMQRWNLSLAPGAIVDPWRQITTAPRNGVKMTVSARQA
jgi:cytochrome P450